jgi:hypothetical protein
MQFPKNRGQALARVADAAGRRVSVGEKQRGAGGSEKERPSSIESTVLLRSRRNAVPLSQSRREILFNGVSDVARGPKQVPLLPVKRDFATQDRLALDGAIGVQRIGHHVRRHPLTMFIDPCSHHDRSRFHAFRMATRPALRHRVFATGERPATGTADLVNAMLAPPSRTHPLRFIVVRCPTNAGGPHWMTPVAIQCP